MLSKTNTEYLKVIQALKQLPPPPSADPVSELQQILFNFTNELSSYSQGSMNTPTLIQSSRSIYETFRLNLLATEPTFVAKSEKENALAEINLLAELELTSLQVVSNGTTS